MSKDNQIAGTYQVSPAAGYAGDVAPAMAWKILGDLNGAVLVDVRTRPEWSYVGLPDLEAQGVGQLIVFEHYRAEKSVTNKCAFEVIFRHPLPNKIVLPEIFRPIHL
ncbi:MAG: hypothetical protein EBU32_05315 [Opitutaceae bacterium]|nr:hypothetical protein [Opitutaceae bacterium]